MTFVQISDSHIGFNKPANPDVVGTLKATVDKINALPRSARVHHSYRRPQPYVQAGGIRHSRPGAKRRPGRRVFVPGEHDRLNDDGKQYLERYGKGTEGVGGTASIEGVHFVGLVNVRNLKRGARQTGAGSTRLVESGRTSLVTQHPDVVFAHIPLWSIYPEWGWGTDDSAQALGL